MRRVKLDHVVIAVSNRERSNDFYRLVLGADVVSALETYSKEHLAKFTADELRSATTFRMYRFGTVQLNVHGPNMNVDPKLLAKIPVPPGGSDLCFEWPGPIEEAIEHLARCKVPIEFGPRATGGARGQGTSVYFRDPDGSLLEFISYSSNVGAG